MTPCAVAPTRRHSAIRAVAGGALLAHVLTFAAPATAQSPADFFKGKTITILVGAGAGGSFMLYAQLLADHMKRHVPGQPNMVVKSMGGQGGGLDTANLMQNAASKDGLTMGLTQQTIVIAQVIFGQLDSATTTRGVYQVRQR